MAKRRKDSPENEGKVELQTEEITEPTSEDTREIAEKTQYLFNTYLSSNNQRYTYADVERATGGKLKYFWIWKLAHGQVEHPGLDELKQLAKFFRVDPSFWLVDLAEWRKLTEETKLKKQEEQATVQQIATRSLKLTPQARQIVLSVIDSLEKNGLSSKENESDEW